MTPIIPRIRRGVALASLIASTSLAGCFSLGGSPGEPVRIYDISPAAPTPRGLDSTAVLRGADEGNPSVAGGPEVLVVEPFTVDASLDVESIVWRSGDVDAGAYEGHRWARLPADIVRGYLADALREAAVTAVVATDPVPEGVDFILRGHLERFDERDIAGKWEGVLLFEVALVRRVDGIEFLRRRVHLVEPSPERNPKGTVQALREALRKAGISLAAEVASALDRARSVPPGSLGE
jgi:uncharacterized lipoprotein YmbA